MGKNKKGDLDISSPSHQNSKWNKHLEHTTGGKEKKQKQNEADTFIKHNITVSQHLPLHFQESLIKHNQGRSSIWILLFISENKLSFGKFYSLIKKTSKPSCILSRQGWAQLGSRLEKQDSEKNVIRYILEFVQV